MSDLTPADITPAGDAVTTGYQPDPIIPQPVAWLTPAVRSAIYAAIVAVGAVGVALGIVTTAQAQTVAQTIDGLLAVLPSILAMAGAILARVHVPR